jgi:hypothetical protein
MSFSFGQSAARITPLLFRIPNDAVSDMLALVGDFLDLDAPGNGMLTPQADAIEIAEMARWSLCGAPLLSTSNFLYLHESSVTHLRCGQCPPFSQRLCQELEF